MCYGDSATILGSLVSILGLRNQTSAKPFYRFDSDRLLRVVMRRSHSSLSECYTTVFVVQNVV